jgi:crotonobetainyl-CoA:carnitine CoA-transferase CaiB-like acyl-CoA transferase
MDRPELLEQFPDVRARARGARDLDAAIEAWTETRPAREVEAALVGIGFPAGRVRDPVEAARDPAVAERALLEELRHPDAPADRPSGFLGARLPIAFAGRVDLPPAEPLGTSTEAVLRDVANCDDAEIARLRAEGVIA